ncbi:MAG: PASTA domain-containing protein [Candidatus Eremiobacteraeota bacterium]|nr:PASTA domain-containing protein [Candidatus Eremiobacteraeota bacterium]
MKKKNRLFYLVLILVILIILAGYYFLRGRGITVPDLTGRTFSEAESVLDKYGLRVAIERTVSETINEESKVISQFPRPGTRLGKGGYVHIYFGGEANVKIPRLVHISQGEAEMILSNLELAIEIEEKSEPEAPFRQVLEQRPGPGTDVKPGSTVTLVVNKARRRSQVPSLIGLSEKEARDLVSSCGLRLDSGLAPSARFPPGKVISQDPPAGSLLADNSKVHVTISDGMEGLICPDLEGKSILEARAILLPSGLNLIPQEEDSEDNWQIIRQDPPAGTPLKDMNIKVWCTSTLVMPVLVGRSLSQAKALLRKNGFLPPVIKYVENNTQPGIVLEQEPEHGLEVPADTEVNLVVSGNSGEDKN